MRKLGKKWKGIISLGAFIFLVFYIEVISYIVNTNNWVPFPKFNEDQTFASDDDLEKGPLRVLLVADPQIQGENNELPFLGLFTRWDADRYLQRNYMLAKFHVQPHVVIFLGDLFDEGSIATDPEYRRYYRRFSDVFQLPRKQDPSPIDYLFIPGDNDVGGEGVEPVNPIKLKWFNQTFGDFKKPLRFQKAHWNLHFLKMNLFLPDEYQNPLKGHEQKYLAAKNSDFRILISHTSLLQYRTNAVQTIVEKLDPSIIFAAHSHQSSYFELVSEGKGSNSKDRFDHPLKISHKFLLGRNYESYAHNWMSHPDESNSIDAKDESHRYNSTLTLNLNKLIDNQGRRRIHEINVPTCSYRMGVPHMGFGAFHLYKNGTLEYTVLWLPSRLNQLYTYVGIYIIMKISIISWLFYKLISYVLIFTKRQLTSKTTYQKV